MRNKWEILSKINARTTLHDVTVLIIKRRDLIFIHVYCQVTFVISTLTIIELACACRVYVVMLTFSS